MQDVTLHIQFIKEDSLNRKIPEAETRLKTQIKALRKQLEIVGRSSALRYEGIWQSVNHLGRDVKDISLLLLEVRNKIGKIENSLGYYSGA